MQKLGEVGMVVEEVDMVVVVEIEGALNSLDLWIQLELLARKIFFLKIVIMLH